MVVVAGSSASSHWSQRGSAYQDTSRHSADSGADSGNDDSLRGSTAALQALEGSNATTNNTNTSSSVRKARRRGTELPRKASLSSLVTTQVTIPEHCEHPPTAAAAAAAAAIQTPEDVRLPALAMDDATTPFAASSYRISEIHKHGLYGSDSGSPGTPLNHSFTGPTAPRAKLGVTPFNQDSKQQQDGAAGVPGVATTISRSASDKVEVPWTPLAPTVTVDSSLERSASAGLGQAHKGPDVKLFRGLRVRMGVATGQLHLRQVIAKLAVSAVSAVSVTVCKLTHSS